MYLQGNLQNIFDALYHLGVIGNVLKLDWADLNDQRQKKAVEMRELLARVNQWQGERAELIRRLEEYEPEYLRYLAMEVALELAEFETRTNVH